MQTTVYLVNINMFRTIPCENFYWKRKTKTAATLNFFFPENRDAEKHRVSDVGLHQKTVRVQSSAKSNVILKVKLDVWKIYR